jgi:hypothetical protein
VCVWLAGWRSVCVCVCVCVCVSGWLAVCLCVCVCVYVCMYQFICIYPSVYSIIIIIIIIIIMIIIKQHEETIDHLTSGCPILAKNEYLKRHDKVCTHLHYSICKALVTENQRQMVHTHAQASVGKGRCHSVVESNSPHRQRS